MQLATLCYVRSQAKTLMMFRGTKPGDIHAGKWNGLGGKLEQGEDPESCVIREVFEESGLTIAAPRLVGILTFPKFKDDIDWNVFVYWADSFSGELGFCEEGELQWISDSELLALPLWEGDREFLPYVLENRFFTGRFVYDNKKLIEHSLRVHPNGLE